MGSPADVGRPPLRLWLVTTGATIPSWLGRCLDDVTRGGAAEVVGLVQPVPAAANRRGLLYRLHAQLDRRLFCRVPDALAPIRVSEAFPAVREGVWSGDESSPADVVLDVFSQLDGDAALSARYGVWTITFGASGDAKTQSLPGYWEVVEGRPTEARLCIRRNGVEGARVLHVSVAPTDRRSVSRSQNHVYWKMGAALATKLQAAWQDPEAFLREFDAAAPFAAAERRAPPGTLAVVRATATLARRYVADKWRNARYREQWALAYRVGPGPLQTLLPPLDRIWADPFPVRRGNEYYVFHEEMRFASPKGSLVVTVLDASGKPLARCIPVLAEDHHLSYPFVFQWDGDFFMIPESAERERVQLYRCLRFPDRWKPERVLLSGLRAFDPTPALLCGRWWLFATVAAFGTDSMDALHLFHADSPLGPWIRHDRNPVKSDVRSARPAGHVFERDGCFYRPAQDCSRHYGYAVSINRIQRLSPDAFEEVEVGRILPDWDPQVAGVHTFNVAGSLTVIDCLMRRRRR